MIDTRDINDFFRESTTGIRSNGKHGGGVIPLILLKGRDTNYPVKSGHTDRKKVGQRKGDTILLKHSRR